MAGEDRTALFEKIAKMELMGVPRVDIADTVGLSESRHSQLFADDDGFKRVYGEVSIAEYEKFSTLNDGWDTVESLAVVAVMTQLQQVPDPDYALRAAALANKAQRRGVFNRPIGVTSGQRKTTINLNASFVDKLQMNFQLPTKEAIEAEVVDPVQIAKKDVNFMPPTAVEDLLSALGNKIKQEDEGELAYAAELDNLNFAIVGTGS